MNNSALISASSSPRLLKFATSSPTCADLCLGLCLRLHWISRSPQVLDLAKLNEGAMQLEQIPFNLAQEIDGVAGDRPPARTLPQPHCLLAMCCPALRRAARNPFTRLTLCSAGDVELIRQV